MSWEVRTMQSKTSYFNATLFRKNLTRFWPLWGLASFIGAHRIIVHTGEVRCGEDVPAPVHHIQQHRQREQSADKGR